MHLKPKPSPTWPKESVIILQNTLRSDKIATSTEA
jgi:hypothetical protein